MQFIEHYQNDLVLSKLIEIKNGNKEVQNELLNTLLGSFRPPQSSSILPSSPLFNQEHEFNYRKVVKAVKLEAHD